MKQEDRASLSNSSIMKQAHTYQTLRKVPKNLSHLPFAPQIYPTYVPLPSFTTFYSEFSQHLSSPWSPTLPPILLHIIPFFDIIYQAQFSTQSIHHLFSWDSLLGLLQDITFICSASLSIATNKHVFLQPQGRHRQNCPTSLTQVRW